MAQQVGLSLRTVQRDLRAATFARRQRRSDRGNSSLNPYKPYLRERWNAGCYTAMRLFRDLRQRGYAGGYGVVAAYARRLRQAQSLPPGHRYPRQPLPVEYAVQLRFCQNEFSPQNEPVDWVALLALTALSIDVSPGYSPFSLR